MKLLNFKKICDFFDYDYDKYGYFNSEIDIYKWITKSKYFNKSYFINELNHDTRHKIDTRPMFNNFVNWIISLDDKNIIKHNRQYEALIYFDKIEELDKLINLSNLINIRKEKFNANKLIQMNVVSDVKELGNFMSQFKKFIINKYNNFDNFDDYLDNNNIEQINNEILLFNN